VLRLLIQKGVAIDAADVQGRTPYDVALANDHPDAARELRAAGARVRGPARDEKAERLAWLQRERAAQPAAAGSDGEVYAGWSALEVAAWRGQTDLVSALAGGAESRRAIRRAAHALTRAAWKGHVEIVRKLLRRAKPDTRGRRSHRVCFRGRGGHLPVVPELLAAHADPRLAGATERRR
jgi:ankyrin repeat protein